MKDQPTEPIPQSDTQPPLRVNLEGADHFDREGFSGDTYVSNDENRGFNAKRIEVHGRHPRKQVLEGNTRSYFVVQGNGTFTLGDETYEVVPNDLYVIPAGSEYEYEGEMVLFEFNVSPDNSFGDEKLE